ncbi:GldG family protein [Aphanothece sacrum]|nr:Gldg family protein [Aphanothece sacrum]
MNKFSNYLKLLKYFYIPGLILGVSGLVANITTKTWSPLYLGLVIGGGILLVIWLGYILLNSQGFWQKRSTQAGTNTLVTTISLLVILGLINFLAIRYAKRIDFSENQLFTLSPQSQEVVQNLKEPVKIWIFDKETNPKDKDLLENYRRYNNKFEFEVIDPDQKIALTKEFNVKSLGDVYLQYGDKKQIVQTLIAFNNREPLSEIKLTNAIEKIQKNYTPIIYVLQGHGETTLEEAEKDSMSLAISSLKDKGYEVQPLNLVERSEIPQDADVIIIAGPKRKLFEQEVQALKTYSDQGGNLLLLLDPNTDPGLEPLLKEWGIQLDNRIIIDGSGSGNLVGLGPTTPIITTYGDHPITKEFGQGISFYPVSRPIDTVEVKDVTATALLVTNEQMWAESDLTSEDVSFDPKTDIAGPFDLGVALTKKIDPEDNKTASPNKESTSTTSPETKASPTPNKVEEKSSTTSPNKESTSTESSETKSSPNASPNDDKKLESSEKTDVKKTESRLVIIGNSSFANNNLFGQQLNGDIFLNSVQWLGNKDEQLLSIRPKEAKNRRINLTSFQANLLALLALVIVPLSALVAAGITWWRKR